MKIVFSRKGFDSQYGRVPSPIFPDGTALSLPIPDRSAPTRFVDVRWRDQSLAPIVECLSKGRIRGDYACHLDPDLRADALERSSDWRPAFGQVGAAQSHLARQGVGRGDLFLYFGWFRPVELRGDCKWRYVAKARAVHRLFGWLQVADVVSISDPADARSLRPWLSAHPHLHGGPWPSNNTVYVATETLNVEGLTDRSGGGLFDGRGDGLTLTAPGAANRSEWRLPGWFWPTGVSPTLSYHADAGRWWRSGPWVHLNTVGRGQEFVFDARGIPEARAWLRNLFR